VSRSRQVEVEKLVAAYRTDLLAAGMFAQNSVTSPARSFLSRIGVECERSGNSPGAVIK
jgi:hypothetical protein